MIEPSKAHEPYPLLIGEWTLNQLLNEYKRIRQKKSRLRRSERQKVITVFNFIVKNELIRFEKPKEPTPPEEKEEEVNQ